MGSPAADLDCIRLEEVGGRNLALVADMENGLGEARNHPAEVGKVNGLEGEDIVREGLGLRGQLASSQDCEHEFLRGGGGPP